MDETTRLDNAEAGPGSRLTYNCTLTPMKASEVDLEVWKRDFVPTIRKNIKETEGMRYLFEIGTKVLYRYYGNNGELFDEIVMTPDEVLTNQEGRTSRIYQFATAAPRLSHLLVFSDYVQRYKF